MPIKNFRPAGERERPMLPEIGRLRKGEPKGQSKFPKEIDYFRFTSEEPELVTKFHDVYGAEPREIDCIAAYDTVDETFQTWNEAYTKTEFIRRCDGWNIDKEFNQETKFVESWSHLPDEQKPPCHGLRGSCDCSPRGLLSLVLPQLGRLGAVIVPTGSKHDINNVLNSLRYLYELSYSRGGALRSIPLRLIRSPKEVRTPHINKSGNRSLKVFHFLKLEAHPNWVEYYARQIFSVSGHISPEPLEIEGHTEPMKALPLPVLEQKDDPAAPPSDRPTAQEAVESPVERQEDQVDITPQKDATIDSTAIKPHPEEDMGIVPVHNKDQIAQGVKVQRELETILPDKYQQRVLARVVLGLPIPEDWYLSFEERQVNEVVVAATKISDETGDIHAYLQDVIRRGTEGLLNVDKFNLDADLIQYNDLPF